MEINLFTGKEKIKVKALGLFLQEDFIFVSKSYDSVRKITFIGRLVELLSLENIHLIRYEEKYLKK